MASQCQERRQEYENLKALKAEFDLEYQKAIETGNLNRVKELKTELEVKKDALSEKLWLFEWYSAEKFKEQYQKTKEGYKEFGWLKTLSSGEEGIIDEKGNEYPIPSLQEVKKRLNQNRELFAEKLALMENPRIHLTPFALNPESMKDDYGKQIEDHFVEEKVEGETRIPDKDKTKLWGRDGQPLELRTDKENVFFDDCLKRLAYFPRWEKDGPPTDGLTKEEAVAQIGGWRIIIIEDIAKAPEKGEASEKEREIRIRGKTKKVKRKPVTGGLKAADQYQQLKQQNEEGWTLEDWLSFAMLYLKENNTVLDDDKGTNYLNRLLGVSTADSDVPSAYWRRDYRRANLVRSVPSYYFSGFGVRASVKV